MVPIKNVFKETPLLRSEAFSISKKEYASLSFLKEYHLDDSNICVRVQSNGSVSAAFKNKSSNYRGLFFGQVSEKLNGMEDSRLFKEISDDDRKDVNKSTKKTLYSRYVENI